MSQNNEIGKAHVYLCGGAGANIGHHFESLRGVQRPGFAQLDLTYLDTSNSNLKNKQVSADNVYLVERADGEKLDGSGKQRAENIDAISGRVREIINQFKPGDLNIVVSSGGGGSGSVIAPSLVSELLKRELPTVVILVGSHSSRTDAQNTLNTLKSYDAIGKKRGVPVVMSYFINSKATNPATVDGYVRQTIASLLLLASRQNEELDTKDVQYFLRTDKSTTYKDTYLASLTVCSKSSDYESLGSVMSVATLVSDPAQDPTFPGNTIPDIQFKGITGKDVAKSFDEDFPLNFVTTSGSIYQEYKVLDKIIAGLNEVSAARQGPLSLASDSDDQNDSGVIV